MPAGIPMGAINTIDRVVEHPQVKARNVLVECEHPTAGKARVVGAARAAVGDAGRRPRAGARCSASTPTQVLREHLGLDDAEIDRLRAIGALGAASAR